MTKKIKVSIVGGSGYTGIELLRLLCLHPNVDIHYITSRNDAGRFVCDIYPSLRGTLSHKFVHPDEVNLAESNIVFFATPNGIAMKYTKELLDKGVKVIDLSADFRLKKASNYLKWYKQRHRSIKNIKKSIYALPEITGSDVKRFNIIGCPGCYPTSILLPLIPLIKKNLIKTQNIIIDSKSGYSGAGRGVHKKYKDKNLYESLSSYGVGFHRHNSEIQQEIDSHTKKKFSFTFTPHLSPMFRGILSTIYLDLNKGVNIDKLENALNEKYLKSRFVKILKHNTLISTNDVINTNNCYLSICKTKYKNRVIILSAIDNLIKGGAGQAIQNMNLKYNFPEMKGL